jgi:hypothetical protein
VRSLRFGIAWLGLTALCAATITVVPDATQNGVTVGPGWSEASTRQLVRTQANVVYVITADDDPCQIGSSSSGVIHAWKGSGAQAQNPLIPSSFSEMDSAHHPVAANAGSCFFVGNSPALASPDIRLDSAGIIHVVYTDPGNGTLYYQTFSTASDTWGTRVALAVNASTNSGTGWVRQVQVALTLDSNNIPNILYATSGTSNTIRYANRIGGAWSSFTTVASGTDLTHPSMVTALDGSIHAAWLASSYATHAVVQYAHYTGTWSAAESVDTGGNVLGNGDNDQGPSIATDLSSLPHVLYLVGTVNGADNDVRLRYRTAGGVWTDDSPPSSAGGASSASGTWYTHTPQNYISTSGDDYVFLGHDVNISPAVFEYQLGGVGNTWHAATQVDPRNQTNTTAGGVGIDGSASVRFDPLQDNNPAIIDLLYYDENDGTANYDHHATLYYKAIVIATLAASTPVCSPIAGTYSSAQSIACSNSTNAVMCWQAANAPSGNGAGTCTSGTTYSGTISVGSTLTLYLISTLNGYSDSALAAYSYTIKLSGTWLSPAVATWKPTSWQSATALNWTGSRTWN